MRRIFTFPRMVILGALLFMTPFVACTADIYL